MKIRQLLLLSVLFIITYSCFNKKEIPTAAQNSEDYTKNLKILNTPDIIPGIKYSFISKKDYSSLEKEYSNKNLSSERKQLLENSLDLIDMMKRYGLGSDSIRRQTFYFNKDSLAILKENLENETFSLIKTKKDSIFYYWTNESGKFYHNRNITSKPLSSSAPVNTVEIEEVQNANKNILGFNCRKVRIVVRNNSPLFKGQDFRVYEVYLTDEIEGFPPHLIFAGRVFQVPFFPKINGCALEITKRNNEYPHIYSVIRATEIVSDDSTIFEIPDSLRSAVRFYNTIHGGEDTFEEEENSFGSHAWLDSLECHGIY